MVSVRKRATLEGCDLETWVKHGQPSLMMLPTMLGRLDQREWHYIHELLL
jgi:hypothetical protein